MDERKEMGGEEKEEEEKRKRLGQAKVWHSHCPLQDRPRPGSGKETENQLTQCRDDSNHRHAEGVGALKSPHGFTERTSLLLRELFRAASEYDLTSSDSSVCLDFVHAERKRRRRR